MNRAEKYAKITAEYNTHITSHQAAWEVADYEACSYHAIMANAISAAIRQSNEVDMRAYFDKNAQVRVDKPKSQFITDGEMHKRCGLEAAAAAFYGLARLHADEIDDLMAQCQTQGVYNHLSTMRHELIDAIERAQA